MNYYFRRRTHLPILLPVLALLVVPVQAQFTSGIEGIIRDPSGGVVPGASVTVTNVDTRISREVVTSDAGFYRVTSLPAGTFQVSVSLPGFKTTTVTNIQLEVNQSKTVNVNLEIGEATTEVTVVGAPPPVEVSEARVSGWIDDRNVQELPLVGRNFYSLVVLTPGATGLPSGGGQAYAQATADIFNAEFGVNLNANGQRAESNSFLIDSASVNASPRGGVANLTPNADSVEELRVSVNNFSAEYGRNSSVMVNVVTKAGTNSLHGTLGWFHTQDGLTSRNVFQSRVPSFIRNEFNWSLGGPIVKDHTFFFISGDVLDSAVGVSRQTNVVSPEFVRFMQQNHPNRISTFIMSEFPAKFTPVAPSTLAGPLAGHDCNALAGGPGTPVQTPLGCCPVTSRWPIVETFPIR